MPPPAPWRVVGLPGQTRPFTKFEVVTIDGERALRIDSDKAYGNLVHPLRVEPGTATMSWRWRVDTALPDADLRQRATEDMPVRVCVSFDLPLASLPFFDRQLLRAARAAASDELPTATVCYVWVTAPAVGSEVVSPFTRRIRYIVLHVPETALKTWHNEQRDVGRDFLKLFGDEAQTVPAINAVLVGGDADSTQGRSQAYVSEVSLR